MGFGSVSKLVAIATVLKAHTTHFVGEGLALDFARRNAGSFTIIEERDVESLPSIRSAIEVADCAFVVRDPDLALWTVKVGRPLFFFDSLFSFWQLGRPLENLVAIAADIRRLDPVPAFALLHSVSPHERVIVAHILANRSFAQQLPGVDERIAALRRLGCDQVCASGPIVDMEALNSAVVDQSRLVEDRRWELVVNLGGFKNFLLDFETNNAYLRLVERWLGDYLLSHLDCGNVLVCCGAYATGHSVRVGGRSIDFRLLPQADFIRAVAAAPTYLCTPGLTSIHESLILNRLPLLLPEEHYGHLFNVRAFRNTRMAALAVGLDQVIEDYAVPEDDFAGTRAILKFTEGLLESSDTYRRFCAVMNNRVDQFREISRSEQSPAVAEVRALLEGPALETIVAQALQEAGALSQAFGVVR
jgi:hypothetical protein